MTTSGYTARHRALLRAVGEGRGALVGGSLTVDGRWCDNFATIDLIRAGLVRPVSPTPRDVPTAAVLTNSGTAHLRTLTL